MRNLYPSASNHIFRPHPTLAGTANPGVRLTPIPLILAGFVLQLIDVRAGLWRDELISTQSIWKITYYCLFHWEVTGRKQPMHNQNLIPTSSHGVRLWYPTKGSKARFVGSNEILHNTAQEKQPNCLTAPPKGEVPMHKSQEVPKLQGFVLSMHNTQASVHIAREVFF